MQNCFEKRSALAGLTTFFTAAYLLIVYPQILSEGGFEFSAALAAQVTILSLSTAIMALYANFPAVVAPGLSVAAYLVFSAIQKQGVRPQEALGLVFWSGAFVFLISLLKVRQKMLLHLPNSIKFSAIGGIGLFLICIGLKNLQILFQPGQLVAFEGFAAPPFWIAFGGTILLLVLHYRKINSAFLWAILVCWAGGAWLGLARIESVFAAPPSFAASTGILDFTVLFRPSLWGALVSVFLISLFDSSASLTALARLNGQMDSGGKIQNIDRIVIPDGLGSMLGAAIGATSLSFTLESSAGIQAGGRKGGSALIAAVCCLIGLFFYPLLSSIPLFATTPALIAIGIFMATEVKEIRWNRWTEAVPAVLTLVTIPLTFSIYHGFAFGFISYAALKLASGERKDVHPLSWGLALLFATHLLLTRGAG
jgi:AGZA family xanthine/uracil permease-like MFS transporter